MKPSDCFLSLVLPIRNEETSIVNTLRLLSTSLATIVRDYELIVVDNNSTDETLPILQQLIRRGGVPNLQIFSLGKQVRHDEATWIGVESALGDYVAAADLSQANTPLLLKMLTIALSGSDVVFAENAKPRHHGIAARLCRAIFYRAYKALYGIQLDRQAPRFRLLHRKVVTDVLRHARPSLAYRHLPVSGGYLCSYLSYETSTVPPSNETLRRDIDLGIQLLLSSTHAPLRLVTTLCVFGATSNVLYSFYVLGILLVKRDIAPGWVSLSLQQSGMFFLLSIVQLVMSEYVLQSSTNASDSLTLPVVRRFHSEYLSHHKTLNIDERKRDGAEQIPAHQSSQGSISEH